MPYKRVDFFSKFTIAASLAIVSFMNSSPAVMAAFMHSTGAPLAANRQMTSDGSDPTNPFSYPFLANITKAMAKNGVPSGFFLGGGDPKNSLGVGIDLRTLLLFEAGVLKNPVKLFLPSKRKAEDNLPSLSMPAMPESSGEMPSLSRRLSNPEESQNKEPLPPSVAAQPGVAPTVSLDLSKFRAPIAPGSESGETGESNRVLAQGPLGVPLSPTLGHAASGANKFRFWTVYSGVRIPEAKIPGFEPTDYEGSFVMTSPGSIKLIEGRTFHLKSGKILGSSLDKSIAVETPLAFISIPAGASAIVEMVKPGLTVVRALETNDNSAIQVRMTQANKSTEHMLKSGEDMLIADHSVTATDRTVAGVATTGESSELWTKGKFNLGSYIDKDSFLRSDSADQNPEQRSAINSLRKRLK